jgi:hypothetical protein
MDERGTGVIGSKKSFVLLIFLHIVVTRIYEKMDICGLIFSANRYILPKHPISALDSGPIVFFSLGLLSPYRF